MVQVREKMRPKAARRRVHSPRRSQPEARTHPAWQPFFPQCPPGVGVGALGATVQSWGAQPQKNAHLAPFPVIQLALNKCSLGGWELGPAPRMFVRGRGGLDERTACSRRLKVFPHLLRCLPGGPEHRAGHPPRGTDLRQARRNHQRTEAGGGDRKRLGTGTQVPPRGDPSRSPKRFRVHQWGSLMAENLTSGCSRRRS